MDVVELGGVSWWMGVLGVVVVEEGCNAIKMGVVVEGVIAFLYLNFPTKASPPRVKSVGSVDRR